MRVKSCDQEGRPRSQTSVLSMAGAGRAKSSIFGGSRLSAAWVPPLACAPLTPTEDVFPCKDCGIWYRSERNLQAHLLYYCASRQGTGSPATTATDEKPKETYPNERVCPFPQCRKSCPSASSLEIHMRSHSGEAPCPLPRMPTGAHSSSA